MGANHFPFYVFMETVGVWVPFDFADAGGIRCDGGSSFMVS